MRGQNISYIRLVQLPDPVKSMVGSESGPRWKESATLVMWLKDCLEGKNIYCSIVGQFSLHLTIFSIVDGQFSSGLHLIPVIFGQVSLQLTIFSFVDRNFSSGTSAKFKIADGQFSSQLKVFSFVDGNFSFSLHLIIFSIADKYHLHHNLWS